MTAVAEKLARLMGLSRQERVFIQVAGYLHDPGKLSTPREILEKAGPLTPEEYSILKSHPYYTFQLLSRIETFQSIVPWASFHHEGLRGDGYPFHLTGEEIPLGSRIIQAADVFTALLEDRPYRKGMSIGEVRSILPEMVKDEQLDGRVIGMLDKNIEEINAAREQSQREILKSFLSMEVDKIEE